MFIRLPIRGNEPIHFNQRSDETNTDMELAGNCRSSDRNDLGVDGTG